jgi:hypothetical protein
MMRENQKEKKTKSLTTPKVTPTMAEEFFLTLDILHNKDANQSEFIRSCIAAVIEQVLRRNERPLLPLRFEVGSLTRSESRDL